MKTSVRNSVLTSLLLFAALSAQAIPDPAIESANLLSAPALWPRITPEVYENITFQVKNYGDPSSDNRIKVTISLSALGFDETFNPAIHISLLSGTTPFTFLYDETTKVITAVLAGNFATGDAGVTTFSINKLVVQQISPKPQILIGANINVVTFGALNSSTSNDTKSIYTYTSSRISGNVFIDANGNAIKDGSETYTTGVWANLVRNGVVDSSVAVNGSGYYLFNDLLSNTNYTIVLTKNQNPKGNSLSAANLPGTYVATGVNLADIPNTSNKSNSFSLMSGVTNFFKQDFAIEQAPTALTLDANYNTISANEKYILSPNAAIPQAALGGTDPEEINLGTGSKFLITFLPIDAKLFYDGIEITASDVSNATGAAIIPAYNPDKLAFSFNNISVSNTFFLYKVEDAAGVKSPSAVYSIAALSLLPVTGLQLKGSLIDNVPHLTWNTLTEQNTSHFEIARSYDGINFTTSATVKAVGNSNSLATYNYAYGAISDNKIVYYRITLVDLNGKKTASNIIHLSLINSNITLFPNPATGYVIVNGMPEGAEITLMDLKGSQIQKHKATSSNIKLNISNIASGTYMVQVQQKGEIISSKKFIKK